MLKIDGMNLKTDLFNKEAYMNNCKCGFKFSGPGEFRNCEAFITNMGKSGVICPKCNKTYVDGVEVKFPDRNETHGT